MIVNDDSSIVSKYEAAITDDARVLFLIVTSGNTKFDWFGISCMTTDNFCFICKTD
jgi:hypothetical protein